MGKEEQQEEREVLDSIFPEEIQDVSETEYRVSILLETTEEEDSEVTAPTILLQIQYPEAYPDEAPRLDILNVPNAPKYPHLDIQADKSRLLESLQSTIEENLGMAMIFSLVTTLKDGAELLITERKQVIEAHKQQEVAAAEAEENRKFEGTKVTRETFLEWRDQFKKEMEGEARRKEIEREEELKRKRVKEEKKMTGKELWEKGLAGNELIEEEDDGLDGLEAVKDLKVAG